MSDKSNDQVANLDEMLNMSSGLLQQKPNNVVGIDGKQVEATPHTGLIIPQGLNLIKGPNQVAKFLLNTCYTLPATQAHDDTRKAITRDKRQGSLYLWVGTHWQLINEDALKKDIYQKLDAAQLATDTGYKPVNLKRSIIEELAYAILNAKVVESDTLGGQVSKVAFLNGTYDTATGEFTTGHNTKDNCTYVLPYSYDATATCPKFLEFIKDILDCDPGQVEQLQQYFGAAIAGYTGHQKLMYIFGPRRSGKGTILQILKELAGWENTAAGSITDLGKDFGLEHLVGKRLAIFGDVRTTGKNLGALEKLLQITGGDPTLVNRKNKENITVEFDLNITMASNDPPQFMDSGNAIASRIIPFETARSYEDRLDTSLLTKLIAELPGIINWSLAGLKSLRANGGKFNYTTKQKEAVQRLDMKSKPVTSFIELYYEVTGDPNDLVPLHDFYFDFERYWNEFVGGPGTKVSLPSKATRQAELEKIPGLEITKPGEKKAPRILRPLDKGQTPPRRPVCLAGIRPQQDEY